MSEIHIRAGTSSDFNLLGEIERAADQLFESAPVEHDVLERKILEKGVEDGLLFVAEHAGEVIGFVIGYERAPYLHLGQVSVTPSYGRRGAGRRLVQRVIDEARARGLPGVTLTTYASVPWNRPFYESMGFVVLEEAEMDSGLIESLAEQRRIGMKDRVAMRYVPSCRDDLW